MGRRSCGARFWSGRRMSFGPWVGLLVGPAVGLVLVARHARLILSVPAVGLAIALGVYVTLGQANHHYPVGASWPSEFAPGALVASMAVMLLGADALAERIRLSRTTPGASVPRRRGRAKSRSPSAPS